MKRINFLICAAVITAAFSSGCVERKLMIKSDPPGAAVYFNQAYMGETPIDFDFKWYWSHRVELKKDGYEEISNLEAIKAPPHMWMPFDLVMELLPFKIKDSRELTYTLKPLTEDSDAEDGIVVEKIDLND